MADDRGAEVKGEWSKLAEALHTLRDVTIDRDVMRKHLDAIEVQAGSACWGHGALSIWEACVSGEGSISEFDARHSVTFISCAGTLGAQASAFPLCPHHSVA